MESAPSIPSPSAPLRLCCCCPPHWPAMFQRAAPRESMPWLLCGTNELRVSLCFATRAEHLCSDGSDHPTRHQALHVSAEVISRTGNYIALTRRECFQSRSSHFLGGFAPRIRS